MNNTETITTKRCKTCENHKPADDFYTGRNDCKTCHNSKRINTDEKRLQQNKYLNEYRKERYHNDDLVKIDRKVRARINYILRKSKSGKSMTDYVGIDRPEYKKYLEDLFEEGMNWDNYGNGKGKWNIDHKTPTKEFDLTDENELKKAFHYTNTQPMWSEDNIKKYAKRKREIL